METDLTSVIIGLSSLLIFCAPIIYYEAFKKRASKKFEAHFHGQAFKYNLTLGRYDIWRDAYAIGLNTSADTLIYLCKKDGQEELILKKLDEFRDCRTFRNDPNVRLTDRQTDQTGNVGIVLSYKTAGTPPLYLEFYNNSDGNSILDELAIANRWALVINRELKKKSG